MGKLKLTRVDFNSAPNFSSAPLHDFGNAAYATRDDVVYVSSGGNSPYVAFHDYYEAADNRLSIRVIDKNKNGVIERGIDSIRVRPKSNKVKAEDYYYGEERAFALWGDKMQALVNSFRRDLPVQLANVRVNDVQMKYTHCPVMANGYIPSPEICGTSMERIHANKVNHGDRLDFTVIDSNNDGKADLAEMRLPNGVVLFMNGVLYGDWASEDVRSHLLRIKLFDSANDYYGPPPIDVLYPQNEPTRAGLAVFLERFDNLFTRTK